MKRKCTNKKLVSVDGIGDASAYHLGKLKVPIDTQHPILKAFFCQMKSIEFKTLSASTLNVSV